MFDDYTGCFSCHIYRVSLFRYFLSIYIKNAKRHHMLGWFKKKQNKKNDSIHGEESCPTTQPSAEEDSSGEPSDAHEQNSVDTDIFVNVEKTAIEDDLPADNLSKKTGTKTADSTTVETSTPPNEKSPPSLLKKLTERLAKTRESFTHRLDELFLGKKKIDADLFDDLEEILVTADLGINTTQEILEFARKRVKRDSLSDPQALKVLLKEHIRSLITEHNQPVEMTLNEEGPFVIMVIGVNGVGKTTTIGKIARKFQNSGHSVMLVAADTFRAAASSQLKIWGERNDVRVVAQHEGADPSSVVFDAMGIAKSKGYDVVLVDTAGRLHTKANLMEELKKIKRVMAKKLKGAPHEILLVIDATTGQNGISQALLFDEAVGITGIALTKLDGTAKGGIVANITRELKTPIRFIGVGEQIDDLRDFNADEFVEALFESHSNTFQKS